MRRLHGCFGAGASMEKIMWVLSTHRNLHPFCNLLRLNAWVLCADATVTVDWLLLTRWRSVVRHVTMRARATRRVVS